jgi:hypothetical protein
MEWRKQQPASFLVVEMFLGCPQELANSISAIWP